jgi:hypothetical protein
MQSRARSSYAEPQPLLAMYLLKYMAKLVKKKRTAKFHGKKSLHFHFVVFAAAKRPQMSWSKLCYEAVIALLLHNQKESRRKRACSMIEERKRRKMGLKTCFMGLFIAKSKRDFVLMY